MWGWGYFCHAFCASALPHLMILPIVISNIGKDMTYNMSASVICKWKIHINTIVVIQDMTRSLEKLIFF